MAAYKQFNSQDIIISPLELTKGFTYLGGGTLATASISISSSAQYTASNYYSIERYLGNKFNPTGSSGFNFPISSSEVYNSVKQLYYTNYLSSSNGDVQPMNTASYAVDGTIEGLVGSNAYINYDQTDLNPFKFFPTSSYKALTPNQNGSIYGQAIYGVDKYSVSVYEPTIAVMSIPKQLYGDQIQPKSLKITTESGSYFDDGEGRLKRQNNFNSSSIYVGNVIYPHGMVIFTGGSRKEVTGEFSKYGVQAIAEVSTPIDDGWLMAGNTAGSNNGTPSIINSSQGGGIYEMTMRCFSDSYPPNGSFSSAGISGSRPNVGEYLKGKNTDFVIVTSRNTSGTNGGSANGTNNEVINSNIVTLTAPVFAEIYPGSIINNGPAYTSSIQGRVVTSVTGSYSNVTSFTIGGDPINLPAGEKLSFQIRIMDLETEGEVDETYYNQPGATNNTSPIGLARFAYTVTSQAGVSGAEFGEDTYGGRLVGANDVANFALGNNITCSFSSSFDIFETQYKCTISEDEFNFSQNPSIISGSKNTGVYLNFATSSFFSPYATTVGMYNGANELLAVGKLAQPLPLSQTTDTTILVNIDRQ
jgi:hypothetical protein|tara:strand:+ start:20256 stop:22016 length:1761 start_codon:yes stop_codon:yes gene_type:complete